MFICAVGGSNFFVALYHGITGCCTLPFACLILKFALYNSRAWHQTSVSGATTIQRKQSLLTKIADSYAWHRDTVQLEGRDVSKQSFSLYQMQI